MSHFRWYRDGSAPVRFLTWMLIVLLVLIIVGYVVGTPADARAATPQCTQAKPCTPKEAAIIKRLGAIGRVTDNAFVFTSVRSSKSECKTHAIRRTVYSSGGPAMMWGTMTKTWCYTRKGVVVFRPPAKVQSGVTGFGNLIGYHDVTMDDIIEQRYPWRGDVEMGSWSWRSMKAKQEVPVISLGLFHIQTITFVLTIRAHGDGTSTDNHKP